MLRAADEAKVVAASERRPGMPHSTMPTTTTIWRARDEMKLAAIDVGKCVLIWPTLISDMRRAASPMGSPRDTARLGTFIINTVVPVRNISAATMKQLKRQSVRGVKSNISLKTPNRRLVLAGALPSPDACVTATDALYTHQPTGLSEQQQELVSQLVHASLLSSKH